MLVSVGYMDPGNWASDLEGGSRFGYTLLWVLAVSNGIAIVLQHLASRLGIVTGLDLAQACRMFYPRRVVLALWVLCQLAIVACDLAEVIGSAVALNLLFHIPLVWGAAITVCDVFMILLLQHGGIRRLEAIVIVLVGTIAACLAGELWLTQPAWPELVRALRPTLDASQLYVAVAILGATVMPHNLYLHSALVKTRHVASNDVARRAAVRTSLLNTIVALNLAFCVNAAILIVAADVFHANAITVTDLGQAYHLLTPLLGLTAGSLLFAIALLAAGQSATITGTLAGQVVMLGFLKLEARPLLVRLATRLAAVLPAVVVIAVTGSEGTVSLLLATQVVLSMQLPFAIVPLVRMTSSASIMGRAVNGRLLRWTGIAIGWLITLLNAWLLASTASEHAWGFTLLAALVLGCVFLGYIAFAPLRTQEPLARRGPA